MTQKMRKAQSLPDEGPLTLEIYRLQAKLLIRCLTLAINRELQSTDASKDETKKLNHQLVKASLEKIKSELEKAI